MYTLNQLQIDHISGGARDYYNAAWLTFIMLTFVYYLRSNKETAQPDIKFQDFDNRLSKMEGLVIAQAEQLALLTSSNRTQA